jgi:hypothetical protein
LSLCPATPCDAARDDADSQPQSVMSAKSRHPSRPFRAPHGHLSNWSLALLASAVMGLAVLVKHLI